MASFESSTTSSAGQINARLDVVKTIEFHARSENNGNAFVGGSAVSVSNGRELVPGEPVTYNFEGKSVLFNSFYLAFSAGGDKMDITVVLE